MEVIQKQTNRWNILIVSYYNPWLKWTFGGREMNQISNQVIKAIPASGNAEEAIRDATEMFLVMCHNTDREGIASAW